MRVSTLVVSACGLFASSTAWAQAHGSDAARPAAQPATAAAATPTTAAAGSVTPASEGEAEGESAAAAEKPSSSGSSAWDDIWSRVKLSTKWYLTFSAGQEDGESFAATDVGRGYVTIKFKPVKWFEPRVTLDTHQDDSGDWKMRVKYLHGKFKIPFESVVLSEPNLELGIVHNPWFDYEEHINRYRAEGKMFIERNKILNSADLGATLGALLGEKLDGEYQRKVSSKYPGKYGSVALGLYNGGGYHGTEQNTDKVFMARASLRPLGFIIPHWQASYFIVWGKGNTPEEPDWRLHTWMTSVEHEYFAVTGQLALGAGNQKGDMIDAEGDSYDLMGWSVFGEIKLPWIQSSLIGRFDRFDWGLDGGKSPTSRVIAGHAFHFMPHNFMLASLDYVDYDDPGIPTDQQAKLTFQLVFPP